ncbi:integrase core domain-containing protein [Rugosimonospora africana]|uniref:Integrase catalytic domain-containing protein n=1 Tax=Rugosimonospora africana TaxID=556532 RepID=A0A8J3VWL5_9ACTN|nr:hypothetical protein Raf01_90800 [Rugosimonospora africana]
MPVHRRGSGLHRPGIGTCESFNGRFRDEFLTCEQFDTLLEVRVLAEDWRTEYNSYRPHGSLGWLTPDAYREQWINNNRHTKRS